MQTLTGTKNNVQWPQKGSLLEVSVYDFTKWLDSQPVWPRKLLFGTCLQAGRVTLALSHFLLLPRQSSLGLNFGFLFFFFFSVTNRRLGSTAHASLMHAYDTWNLQKLSTCRQAELLAQMP